MNNDPLTHLSLSCRRIFLRDHVVPVHIGAHDFEKTQAQLAPHPEQSRQVPDDLDKAANGELFDGVPGLAARRLRRGGDEKRV